MKEDLLHFIWLHQYFNKSNLITTINEKIIVLHPGYYNTNNGPDFLNARIRIDQIEWHGHIEIHTLSSDWNKHNHQNNPTYENIILHVVWKNNDEIRHRNGSIIPTMELEQRVDTRLIQLYEQLLKKQHYMPCHDMLHQTSALVRFSTIEQALIQRLEKKAGTIQERLKNNKNNWEETAYQWLAGIFGFKINTDVFISLAERLPYSIIRKHRNHIHQIEALLFGQSGLLSSDSDDYVSSLSKEFKFLQTKYGLKSNLRAEDWKFLRLRPSNFPTLRIAQFAALLHISPNLFSTLMELETMHKVNMLFNQLRVSDYWKTHYRFDKNSNNKVPKLGLASQQNILINAVAPLWVAYGKTIDESLYIDRALQLLEEIPAENNAITRKFANSQWKASNAFDSQGMIELGNNFCKKRNCLQCTIGSTLLQPK